MSYQWNGGCSAKNKVKFLTLVNIPYIFASNLYKLHRHYPDVKHLKLGSVHSSTFSAPGPSLLSPVGENLVQTRHWTLMGL